MEFMLPGILYGASLDEEDLGLRRGYLRVHRDPDLRTTHVEFGRREGEHGHWNGIKLATITHEVPISDAPRPGVAMTIDYGMMVSPDPDIGEYHHTYNVGRDVCSSNHERLVFCINHIIDERAGDIADWIGRIDE